MVRILSEQAMQTPKPTIKKSRKSIREGDRHKHTSAARTERIIRSIYCERTACKYLVNFYGLSTFCELFKAETLFEM